MIGPRSTQDSIPPEAADWYARLRAPDVTELDAVRFRAWLSGDPARRREFEAIDEFWGDLGPLEKSPQVALVRSVMAARHRARHPSVKGRWLIAASVACAAIATAWVWQQHFSGRYVTSVGEQRVVPLADGSVVTLNTATQIRVRYSGEDRRIELLQGQANFEVAKEAYRPFVVTAGQGEVRALGTAFDVYKTGDKVIVTLIEGKVAVSSPNVHATQGAELPGEPSSAQSSGKAEVILSSGQQIFYGSAGSRIAPIAKPATADVPRVTAWRAHKLDFQNTPLADAIAEANRYSGQQIVLDAPQLENARISGVFEAGRNDFFVEGLQSFFHLDVSREADRKIILSSSTE